MYVSLHDHPQELFERKVQVEQLTHSMVPGQNLVQAAARFSYSPDQLHPWYLKIVSLLPERRKQTPNPVVQQVIRGVDGRLEVGAGVDRPERFQEVLEIVNQALFEVRHEIRIGADGPFEALQALPGDTARSKGLIESVKISVAAQEGQIRFANDNIVGCCIVVELLMPFFHKAPGDLFDVMAVHDIEYFITDLLPFSASSHGGQHEPNEGTARGIMGVDTGQLPCEPVLGVAQLPGLGVVVALPV